MKARFKPETTPTERLLIKHLSDPSSPTPATAETISAAIGSAPSTVRQALHRFVRQGLVLRTLSGHTAHFQLMPADFTLARTEVRIPGTDTILVRVLPAQQAAAHTD